MSEQLPKKTHTFQQTIRAFESDLEENFFQIEVDNKAHSLLCTVAISSVKIFNVKRHYKIYCVKYDCYKEESRKRKLELKISARNKQTNIFNCGNEF